MKKILQISIIDCMDCPFLKRGREAFSCIFNDEATIPKDYNFSREGKPHFCKLLSVTVKQDEETLNESNN